jgi:endonuclease/exonuclease/phosphatase family metal-dependent hydrolase
MIVPAIALAIATAASADWDPTNGDWSKADAADLRVMTWNVKDGICSSNDKTEDRNNWAALAHIVAAMKPDVLILQECGDNTGNGTGSGVDNVTNLTTTVNLLLHGGTDPFLGGTVGAYVQKYDASYDLPYIFVSTETDGYNRNIILSRHPFADLNGDGVSNISNFALFPDQYAPGGDGGIRGTAFAEIDLPDATYAGDFVVGNSHLKSGWDSWDLADRLEASQNIAYYIDYLLNGAGTGTPDPNNKVRDNPAATDILDENTPVVYGGDLNEDEQTNGRRGPAEWVARAEITGGTDGTDRDRSDSTYDSSVDIFTGSRITKGSGKLDYLIWQDSIATLRHSWVFYSGNVPTNAMPTELDTFVGGGAQASSWASDHRPVLMDLILPLAASCPPDWNGDTVLNSLDFIAFLNDFTAGNADYNGDTTTNSLDFISFLNDFTAGC